MAGEGPVKELWEEATCSICLDYFKDPVILTECGHNFCRACLTRSWGESGAKPSCPQCRGAAQEGSLRPNHQLASFVEIAKKFTLQEGKDAGANGQVCPKHQELLRFSGKDEEAPLCVVCSISEECKETEVSVVLLESLKAVVVAQKGRVCQKHQEPLKLFCKDDEALICVVCDRSKEHRNHETLPLEEASQEYKKQTKGVKQEAVAKFRQLHTFLEEQENLLLAQMEEVEEEVAKKRDQHLARLSKELSSLESLIQEMEEKSQQPAGDFLQDARSTLKRYEEKEPFANPAAFPLALKWSIWDFLDLNFLLEGVEKQLKDTLDSGLHLQKGCILI
ncbi:PREDICTED: tripartite motif-containing protein 7-like [Gekko japonicus]|uniref:RING-type E3 ubiquitin transferase n=1 Tax=Gekko japonicus TaxID=146911 RepID=A0ABM1KIW9_GEKJA|nr:PREDICTED: tripartite motif-containing protein 7-like [Gekko japonicus]